MEPRVVRAVLQVECHLLRYRLLVNSQVGEAIQKAIGDEGTGFHGMPLRMLWRVALELGSRGRKMQSVYESLRQLSVELSWR